MAKFKKTVQIEDVHRVKRPGIGYVYVGRISIGDLAEALADGDLRYAPKYQRGMKQSDDNSFDSDTLLEITNDKLEIQVKRAEAMAAKYLMALKADPDRMLFNPDVIWNARLDPDRMPEYDQKSRILTVRTTITIPDSAHRHYAYYLLAQWASNPDSIPDDVPVSEDGESISSGELEQLIQSFDPHNEEDSAVLVQVFNVSKEQEGWLFDEYNVEGKRPSNAASIDMYSDKTASRRFVTALMDKCPIFDRNEIEVRSNTIAPASRKLTTIATLDAAIKPYSKRLLELEKEKDGKAKYADLIDFFSHFYTEIASHVPEFQPTASGKARQDLRKRSFAISNILYFPLFRLAFDLWTKYSKQGVDWKQEQEWRDGIARITGEVTAEIGGAKVKVPVMARDALDEGWHGNPAWQGKILVQKFDGSGQPQGWSLSSTRQTRDSAFHYLSQVAGVDLLSKAQK